MVFKRVNPEVGFTSDVIRDPRRFVGRAALISDSVAALDSPQGLLAIYGKRGVGKSSLMRQIQALANGNYELVRRAGLAHLIPEKARRYYTVYYACDSLIANARELIARLCNDTDPEDGLLRLVPDQGKQLSEFSRTHEDQTGLDLKILSWGSKGQNSQQYTSAVPGDLIQTFRNFVSSAVESNNRFFKKRDSVLILLDEFDLIKDKADLGSLIKSLSSDKVKFGICGIGKNLRELITDHHSVDRLIQQGSVHVEPMSQEETASIFETATELSGGVLRFDPSVVEEIAQVSEGYPFFAQMVGKECVHEANSKGTNAIEKPILETLLEKIKSGRTFPTLQSQYQSAIGNSPNRALLLTLLAEQSRDTIGHDASMGVVVWEQIKPLAKDLGIGNPDHLLKRLVGEERTGPVLVKVLDSPRSYEFTDPVFRAYVKLRRVGN